MESIAVIRLTARSLRVHWRAFVALVLLTGLAGGAVLTATAGAIRTGTAYSRFLAWSNASDLLVAPAGSGFGGYYAAVARRPEVVSSATVAGLNLLPLEPDGAAVGYGVTVNVAGGYGQAIDRVKLLAGRLPDASRPGEVAVDQIAAALLHLRVGSTLRLAEVPNKPDGSPGVVVGHLAVRVVGIMVTRGGVLPVTSQDRAPTVVASLALFRQFVPHPESRDLSETRYMGYSGIAVRLRPGDSVAGFTRAAQHLATRLLPPSNDSVFIADEGDQAATIERAIRPQAVALGLFALALALAAVLIVGQVAIRALRASSSDNGTLGALGMTRRQLLAAGLAEVGVAAIAGGILAVVVAVLSSWLTPIGPARLAEPSPGISANAVVLGIGFAAIVALLLARVALTAWRQSSARATVAGTPATAARPGITDWLASAGAPVTAVTGIRFAARAQAGRASVPVRSAVAGLILAVAAVAGAVTFEANMLRLVNTPSLYGQDWDASVDLGFGSFTAAQFDKMIGGVPGVAGWTFGLHGIVGIGSQLVPAIGLDPGRGPLTASTVLAGRPPRTPDEIVLGASVLSRQGLRIGQSVPVSVGGPARPMRIVGSAVFPFFGQGSFTPTDVGLGAETTGGPLVAQADNGGAADYNFVLVRFTPGPGKAAAMAAFHRAFDPFCSQVGPSACDRTDQRPNTVANYASIDATPAVLAAVLAVLGLGVLAQFLLAATRGRRRDLAVLKVLGMLRWQLAAVTGWQVTVVTAAALLAGLPLGIAGGRWAWAAFASGSGLTSSAVTPLPVLWMIPATLAAANLVGLRPGLLAARLRPASVLRAE
jgi:ABC-type antimicrobial peptide transport system permease subunit